jgi:integrase
LLAFILHATIATRQPAAIREYALSGTEPTIQQTVDAFIAYVNQGYAAPSVAAYTQGMRLFLEHLREIYRQPSNGLLSTLVAEQGESYVRMLQITRSVETEHLYSRVVAHFFAYCVETCNLSLDIASFHQTLDHIRRPKSHAIPTVPISCVEQIIQFALTMRPERQVDDISERRYLGTLRDRAFILTIAHSGLRLSEICGLRRHQFNIPESTIAVATQSDLPLPTQTGAAVTAYLQARRQLDEQQHTSDLPLFARHDKRVGIRVLPISRWTGANIVEAWTQLALEPAVRLGLAASKQYITPHTFRHYFVINALRNTERDVATTQAMARHADRSTTRRYLQKLKSDQPVTD